ncbi:MAG: VWA domain-containing protein [Archangiaceae bacterium]|nr:VWA domain-containing protein [Archangiaceae bacterium]
MNRTTAFLVTACALGLVALVVKAPAPIAPAPPRPPPAPVVVTPPEPDPAPPPAPDLPPAARPGSLTLNGKLSHPYVVPGSSDVFATLEVSAVDVPGARRAPVNMALVIDRSGSMSGQKLADAKRAAKELLRLLDERDSLAIVHYGSDVKGLPSRKVTDENREVMRRYIDRLYDDGGTNIGAGLTTGQQFVAQASCEGCVERVVLISDGQPTEGIQSTRGLSNIVQRLHERGVSVTALGIGYDFNEDLMSQLAMVGGGSYGYLRDSAALAAVIQRDLQQAGTLVARDVKLSVRLPQGVQLGEVLGRPFTRSGDAVTVSLPDFSARQVEKLVVRLSASAPAKEGATLDVADFSLDYQDVLATHAADSKLKLAAMVTMDRSLADARRDQQAVVVATRARASKNYQRAAEAMSEGRYEEAKKAVEENKALFFEAERVAGADAVAADRDQNAQAFGLIQAAPTSAPRRLDAVKSMKVQSQRAAGAGDSLY